jgi:hypothetical protein
MADERDDQDKPKSYKTDPDKVKSNDLMAIIQYVKVQDIQAVRGRMVVTPVEGPMVDQPIHVDGRDLITNALSADYFKEEVELTATAMESLIMTRIYNRPISVLYIKENGEKRLLRGRYIDPAPFGRSYMEDMDRPEGDRIRLVDHRTIQYLIANGIKYTVKGKNKKAKSKAKAGASV